MGTLVNPFEQKLETQLQETEKLRKAYTGKLNSGKNLLDIYTSALARLRELNMHDPRKGEVNPKEFLRVVGNAPMEARQAIAFKAPTDGVAKSVMKYLAAFGLSREDALSSALLCILEDCEQSFSNLSEAKLPLDDEELVVLAAIKNYPVFNYEEYKTQEVMYQTANTEDSREMQEIQRRFEQARGKKTQHVRKHILNYLPEDIKTQPDCRKVLLFASLQRDTFGTLETLREAYSSEEGLKSTSVKFLDGIEPGEKLDLLEIAANLGLGLASNYLDIFAIPREPEWYPKLQTILKKDVTAGHSLFGVYAFEGIHHYPFDLGRLEPTLPRRITNSEAMEYLKKNEPEGAKPRTYSSNEVAEVVTMLQEKDVRRFLEGLKWSIGRHWKSYVQEKKRDVVFGDYDLKVRNILFLVTHSLFEEEEKFLNIFEHIQKNHPLLIDDLPKTYLLANRYYFFELLGLNLNFLFNRTKLANGSFGTLIEEVSDYQARNLIHLGMSIHIRVGDALFRDILIAWTMLIGQCDGKIDTVFHELGQLFDAFDTLLTIIEPAISDMPTWVHTLVEALGQEAARLPEESPDGPKQAQLRVTTRTTITRMREGLNRYNLDALYLRAKIVGVTPVSVIQVLKIPRSKSDKLMTLMQNDPLKGSR